MADASQDQFDVAIIGGGIAGLWTASVLKKRGYSVALFSNTPLGQGQTLAAQGVIHGGAKYAIAGKLTDSSEQLAAMPDRWRAALAGQDEVDLRGARVLSEYQYLWSLPSVASQVVSFFGSKLMRGRANSIPREQWPQPLQSPRYRGRVFRIDEPVVDPVSVVEKLAAAVSDCSYRADCVLTANGLLASGIPVRAAHYVLAAGAGNGPLLQQLGIQEPSMQLRPLHQIIIRGPLPEFFSVCIGSTPKPPVVTTTHIDSRGQTLWWVGGDIAEAQGVARSETEQAAAGRELMNQLLPWVPWDQCEFSTARIDRAEPATGTGDRPPGAFCRRIGNLLVTWPTKLALAPDLADQVIRELPPPRVLNATRLELPAPDIGRPPWD